MPMGILDGIDENRSFWISGKAPYEARPPLAEDVTCDVAIIGGGFTGISTAWHLSERVPEKSVVLLEARTLATGASGRNGGLMLNWVNGVETTDTEHAKLVYDATREGIDLVEGIIRRHALPVRFRRDGANEVFTDPARAEAAAKDVERLSAAGIPLRFLPREELAEHLQLEGGFGAVHDPTAAQLDGVGYLRALRPLLLERGVSIYENTPVLSVEEGKKIALRTPNGTVHADAVVLATNAYTPRLGYFRSGIVPVHSHAIATEALSAEAWREIGWKQGAGFSDDLDRIAYGSMTPEGSLVFGGGSNAAYDYDFGGGTRFDRPADKAWSAVHERFLKYFPKAKDVRIAHQWTGTVALTMSRICTMGVLGEHRNLFYAVGFSGHGITLANLAGRVLTDIYVGADERWRKQPFYQQKLLYIPPEPFRWIGYHAFTKLTGKSPRRRP
jgi:gamma-glutamylputrescine oxidase